MRALSIRSRLFIAMTTFVSLLAMTLIVAPAIGSSRVSIARAFDRSIPFADNVDAHIHHGCASMTNGACFSGS
jgi:hypothetical protein